VTMLIDCDQHLYEPRNLWREQCDPNGRDDALAIEDDDLGYSWVTWRGTRLGIADVQAPGETTVIGDRRRRQAAGERALTAYDEVLPDDFWEPAARADRIRAMGFDAAVCFPNFGLMWERRVGVDLPALHTNMGAWNRWCATVVRDSAGTLYPVAHLTMRDLDWLDAQLAALEAGGVKLAMIAPALVDGKQLSHPDLERAWRSFIEHDVTPVFHVADQPRVFDDAWYTDDGTAGVNVVESVFLYTPAALAITDLIVNGVLDRMPELRIGVVELSAMWVPQYLMMLDGGYEFTSKLNGSVPTKLSMRPSEYFHRQVRVAAFSYELPERLERQAGDLFMACSDYPHSEGTATPIDDYTAKGCDPADHPGLFGGNAELLVRS
jgi:predicted TIM-barrel fold metal-dependent hydrolase